MARVLEFDEPVQTIDSQTVTPATAPVDPFDIDVKAIVANCMSRSLARLVKDAAPKPGTSVDRGDRRRHTRIAGRYDGKRSGTIATSVMIHSLSEVGCFVESFSEEAKGRRLKLEVHLSNGEWVALSAEVVRLEPEFGYGVRFVDVPADIRERLAREVAARTAGNG